MTGINTLLVDDHPLLRRGVKQLIEMDPKLRVVAEASDGHEALKLAGELPPDLILLDLNMKGTDGIETLKALKGRQYIFQGGALYGIGQSSTEATVKVHVKHLLKKLNLRTRVEAAVWIVMDSAERD